VTPGHGPLAPQQIDPHMSGRCAPAVAQVSPTPHAASVPHMHAPLTHCSPA
jgi:hypothetical protein